MRGKAKKGVVFSFLLLYTLISPLQVAAAENTLEKQVRLTVTSEEDYQKQARDIFPEEIVEDGITYELADTVKLLENTRCDKVEKTIETEETPAETIIENGIEYTLVSSDSHEEIVDAQSIQTVTAYDEYSYAVTAAAVPATKTVTAENESTGESERVTCEFVGISPMGTRTVSNTITITFSNYDAAYYEWNGNYIPRNDETPQLAGYESQLLATAGAAEGSTITGIYWTGDPYTVDGVVYRDAAADVEQQIQIYRANYEGEINHPEEKKTVYTAQYEAPDPEGEVEYDVLATATYREKPVPVYNYILTAGIILLLLAVIFFLLYWYAKKKKDKEKD